jgi:hypothetical protein
MPGGGVPVQGQKALTSDFKLTPATGGRSVLIFRRVRPLLVPWIQQIYWVCNYVRLSLGLFQETKYLIDHKCSDTGKKSLYIPYLKTFLSFDQKTPQKAQKVVFVVSVA